MHTLVPILFNHDPSKVIGRWESDGIITISDEQNITADQLFNIFGPGAGIRLLESREGLNGERYVRSFQIMEFSLCEFASAATKLTTAAEALMRGAPLAEKMKLESMVDDLRDAAVETIYTREAAADALEGLLRVLRWIVTHEGVPLSVRQVAAMTLTDKPVNDLAFDWHKLRGCCQDLWKSDITVVCTLPKGHDGDHMMTGTLVSWTGSASNSARVAKLLRPTSDPEYSYLRGTEVRLLRERIDRLEAELTEARAAASAVQPAKAALANYWSRMRAIVGDMEAQLNRM